MKKRTAILVCFLVLGAALLFAHTPLLDVYDNGDGTFTCVGGFSNGASAAGVEIRLENPNEKDPEKKVVFKGKLDKKGELVVKYPKNLKKFLVVFDAGPGHVIKKSSDKIEK
ncbi:hypothetical protein [Treponema pedis]|nr:hypothetical protein [Treponema pedis]QOW61498.1 hypothetical protein IFE08_03685 [Treponema pedis]QSI03744.1 hypothetical protein DYQ05_01835 [Treponema pedis]